MFSIIKEIYNSCIFQTKWESIDEFEAYNDAEDA